MSKSSLLPASCFYLPKVVGADSDLTPALQVVVNGTPFYEFKHRIPLQMVTHLHVDGDLMLQSINFIGGQPPSNQVCGVSLSCLLVPFLNAHVYLFPGHFLCARPTAGRFHGPSGNQDSLLALSQMVVATGSQCGGWEVYRGFGESLFLFLRYLNHFIHHHHFVLFIFTYFLAVPLGLQDPCSLTRD